MNAIDLPLGSSARGRNAGGGAVERSIDLPLGLSAGCWFSEGRGARTFPVEGLSSSLLRDLLRVPFPSCSARGVASQPSEGWMRGLPEIPISGAARPERIRWFAVVVVVAALSRWGASGVRGRRALPWWGGADGRAGASERWCSAMARAESGETGGDASELPRAERGGAPSFCPCGAVLAWETW